MSKNKDDSFRQRYALEKAEHDKTREDLFELFYAIETYEHGLKRAKASYRSGQDAGRKGAIDALRATVKFIQSLESLKRQNLAVPLGTLMLALGDLEAGKRSELLRPNPVRNRPRDNRATQLIRLHAAVVLDCLMRLGHRQPEAAKMVASTLRRARFPFGQMRGNPANTIVSWRDQIANSNDAEADFYRREVEHRIVNGAKKSVEGRRLLGQLTDLVIGIAPTPK